MNNFFAALIRYKGEVAEERRQWDRLIGLVNERVGEQAAREIVAGVRKWKYDEDDAMMREITGLTMRTREMDEDQRTESVESIDDRRNRGFSYNMPGDPGYREIPSTGLELGVNHEECVLFLCGGPQSSDDLTDIEYI